MFRNAKYSFLFVGLISFVTILMVPYSAFAQYRPGAGLSATMIGQQEALQQEAQSLNNMYMLQQIQQQEERNHRQQQQYQYEQQQRQAESARQDQLYQMQLENERLKRQLLEQQIQQKNLKNQSQIVKSTARPKDLSVKEGGYCEATISCSGTLLCEKNRCVKQSLSVSTPSQTNSVGEGGSCTNAQQCEGNLLCTNRRCTRY